MYLKSNIKKNNTLEKFNFYLVGVSLPLVFCNLRYTFINNIVRSSVLLRCELL